LVWGPVWGGGFGQKGYRREKTGSAKGTVGGKRNGGFVREGVGAHVDLKEKKYSCKKLVKGNGRKGRRVTPCKNPDGVTSSSQKKVRKGKEIQ